MWGSSASEAYILYLKYNKNKTTHGRVPLLLALLVYYRGDNDASPASTAMVSTRPYHEAQFREPDERC